MSNPSVLLAGATGLTGSASFQQFISKLPSAFSHLTTITRRPLPAPPTTSSEYYTNLQQSDLTDSSTWNLAQARKGGSDDVFVSCLGTTRAQAGGLENQRKIDYDLNLELARKAKEAGFETYILVSTGGANANSSFGYTKMKGELERDVQTLGFKRTFILRPGLLLGNREESRTAEGITQYLFRGFRAIGLPVGGLMVDAEVVGKCIAKLARSKEEGVHFYDNSQIIAIANSAD